MSEFEIRKAIPADADAVADYHDRCFRNTYSSQMLAGEFEAPDLAGTRQQIHDWFLPESGLESRVAVVDGAPIGHVTVCGHQLVHLFVEPDHQLPAATRSPSCTRESRTSTRSPSTRERGGS